MQAFQKQARKQPSFFQKLFGIKPRKNAVIDINNLLAERKLEDITVEDIEGIAAQYRANLKKHLRRDIRDLYGHYLAYCLTDKHLSDAEIQNLKQLRHLLGLNENEIRALHHEIAGEVFREEFEEALQDKDIDEDEHAFLLKLKENLQLPEEITSAIYQKKSRELLDDFMNEALSDERLSPEEEKEFYAIADRLGLTLDLDAKTRAVLEKYKLYWQIENGDLPEQDVSIRLQKNEVCYFQVYADWFEQRQQTRRINYGGPTMRIKIANGLYWRTGSLGVKAVKEDVWKHLDSGKLFVTNKRILFMGDSRNKMIRLNRILDFDAYANGVEIQKDRGRTPFLEFDSQVDIFCMILGRVLSDY